MNQHHELVLDTELANIRAQLLAKRQQCRDSEALYRRYRAEVRRHHAELRDLRVSEQNYERIRRALSEQSSAEVTYRGTTQVDLVTDFVQKNPGLTSGEIRARLSSLIRSRSARGPLSAVSNALSSACGEGKIEKADGRYYCANLDR
jgi:hypothetical protein